MKYRIDKKRIFRVAIFIVIVIALVFVINTRSQTARLVNLINYAGKNGLPVAMLPWSDGRFSFIVPGQQPVFVKIDSLKDSYFCFSELGTLHYVKREHPYQVLSETPFPYRYSHEIGKFNRHFGPWCLPFEDQPWLWPQYCEFSDKGYELNDLVSLTKIKGAWSEPPPYPISPWPGPLISPDLSVMFTMDKPNFMDVNAKEKLMRYDIDSGKWKVVAEGLQGEVQAIGYEGEVVVVPDYDDEGYLDWRVIDGYTGGEVYTIENSDASFPVCVGRNWISSIRYYSDHDSVTGREIIFVNLDDTDEQYSIKFPSRRNSTGPSMFISTFEPPPGGVIEMFEMRKSEKKDVDDW